MFCLIKGDKTLSLHGHAAIDGDHLAGDVGGFFRGEEGDGGGDVVRGSEAAALYTEGIHQSNGAISEACDHFQLSAEGLNQTAQGAQLEIILGLQL